MATDAFPETWPGRAKYAFSSPAQVLGAGTYGTVLAAEDVRTGRRVAIKRVSGVFASKGAVTLARREILLNRRFADHARSPVVRMIDAMIDDVDGGSLYLVFERMDKTLADGIRHGRRAPAAAPAPAQALKIAFDLVRCVAELHAAGVVHRDLKPENVLASADCSEIAICDLGMARLVEDGVATDAVEGWTDYVTTRWYRAPEVICRCRGVDSKHADMWAVGCIVAELLIGDPILPGSSEQSQLFRIVDAIGRMDAATSGWYARQAEDERHADVLINRETSGKERLVSRLARRRCSDDAIDLVCRLLDLMPSKRLTASEALRHRAFAGLGSRDPSEAVAACPRDLLRACEDTFPGCSADALDPAELEEAKAILSGDLGVSRPTLGKRRRSGRPTDGRPTMLQRRL